MVSTRALVGSFDLAALLYLRAVMLHLQSQAVTAASRALQAARRVARLPLPFEEPSDVSWSSLEAWSERESLD